MGDICWECPDVNPAIAGFSAEIHAGMDWNPVDFFSAQVLSILYPSPAL